jgi:hypothetical protein
MLLIDIMVAVLRWSFNNPSMSIPLWVAFFIHWRGGVD